MAINVQGLQGQWNQLKGEIKKQWGQLTDDDLHWGNGNIDQLVGRIQQRTGDTRENIEKFIDHLTSKGSSTVSKAVEQVGSYAQDMSHRLRDHYGDISEQAREGYNQARDYVGRNPVGWVAVAFGVGLVAGLLMGGTVGYQHQPARNRFWS
ncbi:CsbD family protein [Aquisphaera insulae]|uniref:CsbD family protein n=1 Tax=Aquisphaera insulae TaxID=2712864 RepID=UPI0013E9EE33|nr:CsbD family protein [Aquisphaera insulae]